MTKTTANQKAYMKAYYQEHKEEIKANAKIAGVKWRAANPDKVRANVAKWRAANPDKVAASRKKRRKKNSAHMKAYMKAYYQEHKDEIKANVKIVGAKWRAVNPDKVRANVDKRRAAKFDAASDGTTLSDVVALHGPRCLACGTEDDLSVDHVISLFNGGDDTINNKQPLCRSCNSSKGKNDLDYRL